ncbi:MAG: hypothetical protein LUG91_00865 [Ruminococcus sp.]|nr:hypothetical protein [Ruminococcus sp.]
MKKFKKLLSFAASVAMLFTCVQVENAIDITTNAEGIEVVSVTVDADLYGDVNGDGVVDDYGDDRLTVISCTDDGEYRQVVVGILKGFD